MNSVEDLLLELAQITAEALGAATMLTRPPPPEGLLARYETCLEAFRRDPSDTIPERLARHLADLTSRLDSLDPDLRHAALRHEMALLAVASGEANPASGLDESGRPRLPGRLVAFELERRLRRDAVFIAAHVAERRYHSLCREGTACDCDARTRASYFDGNPTGPIEHREHGFVCTACGAEWQREQVLRDDEVRTSWLPSPRHPSDPSVSGT